MLSLTEKRKQVLMLAAKGHTSKTAARELGVSMHTERDMRRAVLNIFGAKSMSEAVYMAAKQGVI